MRPARVMAVSDFVAALTLTTNLDYTSIPIQHKMGRIRYEWNTPKKSRFFALVEHGMSKPQAAKELGLAKATALRWNSDRRTRPVSQKLGRPKLVTDKHI